MPSEKTFCESLPPAKRNTLLLSHDLFVLYNIINSVFSKLLLVSKVLKRVKKREMEYLESKKLNLAGTRLLSENQISSRKQ